MKEQLYLLISPDTKVLMAEINSARNEIRTTTGDKWIALQKYKTLRNRVTNQIRNEVRAANGKRVDDSTNESEYWKVVNGITNAKTETKWKLDDRVDVIEKEEEIASFLLKRSKYIHTYICGLPQGYVMI